MNTIYFPNETRGKADYGWLKARYSFSFGNFFNETRVQFGKLRVLNDDIIEPGKGFGTHPHNNMEIITIPLSGSLAHKDSLGHESIIETGEVQVMSAGSGIKHSEYNASSIDRVNILQIWVFPKIPNIEPRYDQKKFNINNELNQFVTIVAPKNSKEENSLWVNQDTYFNLATIEPDNSIVYIMKNPNHLAYIFTIKGNISIGDQNLNTKDAIGIDSTDSIEIKSKENSRILLIEIPKA